MRDGLHHPSLLSCDHIRSSRTDIKSRSQTVVILLALKIGLLDKLYSTQGTNASTLGESSPHKEEAEHVAETVVQGCGGRGRGQTGVMRMPAVEIGRLRCM